MDRSSYREKQTWGGATTPGIAYRMRGGRYVFDTAGTFTEAKLQARKADTLTWADLDTDATPGRSVVDLGVDDIVRVTTTGADATFQAFLAQVS